LLDGTRFDQKFFSGHRNQDSGHYFRVAVTIAHMFPGSTFLEVGCGRGWIPKRLIDMGQEAEGFDIGKWAIDNKVCEPVFQADLLTFKPDKKWDIVICSNIFAYFAIKEVVPAFHAIGRLFSHRVVVSIQTLESVEYNFSIVHAQEINQTNNAIAEAKLQGRRTFKPYEWWKEKATQAGLVHDDEMLDTLLKNPESWTYKADETGVMTTMVLKHSGND
jgi:2-polyprenyl-3-methyl-5-hydroxy-6-metoxy-1,4-benzoquinol methylase